MDDHQLIQQFLQSCFTGQSILASTPNLRAESTFNAVQLFSQKEGLLASVSLKEDPLEFQVKRYSAYWETLVETLANHEFYAITEVQADGCCRFQKRAVPNEYEVKLTKAIELWRTWRRMGYSDEKPSLPKANLLVMHQGTWVEMDEVTCSQGSIFIESGEEEWSLPSGDLLSWIVKAG